MSVRRRVIARVCVAVGAAGLAALAGLAVARHAWSPLGGGGFAVAAVLSGVAYLRSTRGRQ